MIDKLNRSLNLPDLGVNINEGNKDLHPQNWNWDSPNPVSVIGDKVNCLNMNIIN